MVRHRHIGVQASRAAKQFVLTTSKLNKSSVSSNVGKWTLDSIAITSELQVRSQPAKPHLAPPSHQKNQISLRPNPGRPVPAPLDSAQALAVSRERLRIRLCRGRLAGLARAGSGSRERMKKAGCEIATEMKIRNRSRMS